MKKQKANILNRLNFARRKFPKRLLAQRRGVKPLEERWEEDDVRGAPLLRIMSYNIHFGVGRDRQYRLERVIETIANENPDIVALQEVDRNLARTGHDDQLRILAEELSMDYYHYSVNRRINEGEYGLATLSKLPITNPTRHDLTYRKRFRSRSSLRTDLVAKEFGRLHVFNVHLGLRTRERRFQRQKLLSKYILLDQTLNDPMVVLGDFNDRPIPVVNRKFRQHFQDAYEATGRKRTATFSWGLVKFRLDHIYVNHLLRVVDTYVVENEHSRMASDHLPLVSIVEPKFSPRFNQN